jgi:hypothetical protein
VREQTTPDRQPTTRGIERRPLLRRRFTLAGLTLRFGLGGFIDGIVLHQILQWHHMLTDYGSSTYPVSTVRSLDDNSFWDGLFHPAPGCSSPSACSCCGATMSLSHCGGMPASSPSGPS